MEFNLIDSKAVVKALIFLKENNPGIIPIVNRFMDAINGEGIRLLIDSSEKLGDELAVHTNGAKMSGIDFAVNALVDAIIKEGEKQWDR